MADLKKGARITGAARDKLAAELVKKYNAGQSIRALAEAHGRSYGFVHRLLTEAGATLRGREAAMAGARRRGRRGRSGGSFGADYSSAVLTDDLPVSIYLADGRGISGKEIRGELHRLLRDAGWDLIAESDPIRGSWWQTFRAKATSPDAQAALNERIAKLERAAEVRLLAVPESQANMQNAQGLAAIISALQHESAAVIQLGPLLIVKTQLPGGETAVHCRTLTASQLRVLEHRPELLKDPANILSQLQRRPDDRLDEAQ